MASATTGATVPTSLLQVPMSQSVVTFNSPEGFDAVALASSTRRAIQVLIPWCQLRNPAQFTFAREIVAQAHAYVEAIDSSVLAAQSGFTVAEEAISLGDLISSGTPQQHQTYLVEMLELAMEGHSNAAKTQQAFRDVRKDVLALLQKIDSEHEDEILEFSIHSNGQMTLSTTTFGRLCKDLQNSIGSFQKFAHNIDEFATWWNWMKMTTCSQETITQAIQFNYNSLREKVVIAKWKDLRNKYATYNDQIGRIQDYYPALFIESRPVKRSEKGDRGQQTHGETRDHGAHLRPSPVHNRLPSRTASPNPLGMRSQKSQPTPQWLGRELTGAVLLSEVIPSANYISATFTKAEYVGDRRSLLHLDFQCHPSSNRRFTELKIIWTFKAMASAMFVPPPKVINAAPLYCLGGRSDEQRRTLYGLSVPIQLQAAGASVGVETKTELEVNKVIHHAMTMTGTIRGNAKDHCVWILKENASNASGIPPHFQVAVILEHHEHFLTHLEVKAKVDGKWWETWWEKKKSRFDTEQLVDVGKLKGKIDGHQELLQGVTGEVPHAATQFLQPIVT